MGVKKHCGDPQEKNLEFLILYLDIQDKTRTYDHISSIKHLNCLFQIF